VLLINILDTFPGGRNQKLNAETASPFCLSGGTQVRRTKQTDAALEKV